MALWKNKTIEYQNEIFLFRETFLIFGVFKFFIVVVKFQYTSRLFSKNKNTSNSKPSLSIPALKIAKEAFRFPKKITQKTIITVIIYGIWNGAYQHETHMFS